MRDVGMGHPISSKELDMNHSNLQTILLQKQRKVGPFAEPFKTSFGPQKARAFTLQANLESMGHVFSKEALIQLSHLNEQELGEMWTSLKDTVDAIQGAKHMRPMYPNFPTQVMEASEVELMQNAWLHYAGDWLGVRILPRYEEKVRLPLLDTVKPKVIGAGVSSDLSDLWKRLVQSNVAWSPEDAWVAEELTKHYDESGQLSGFLTSIRVPQKENLAKLGVWILSSKVDFNATLVSEFKTPTDVLRLVVALSKNDVSLAVPGKFISFSRPLRKAVLALLEIRFNETDDKEQFVEDFFRHTSVWKRAFHTLHVGEHQDKAPNVVAIAKKIRENDKPVTFNHRVEQHLTSGRVSNALEELVKRPGVFARMLNQVLKKASEKKEVKSSCVDEVLNRFNAIASLVSTPVLLQVHAHFKNETPMAKRVFMPKGGLSKVYSVLAQKTSEHVSREDADRIVDSCEQALKARFAALPALGKVYVDKALTTQNVPFAQRSASKALLTVSRGSKFQVQPNAGEGVRFFVWWNESGKSKEGEEFQVGRVDIDLSVALLDKDYQHIGVCSYWDLRGEGGSVGGKGALVHSGDVTSAPQGACEFIDVNLSKLDRRVRFVVPTLHAYTEQKYSDLPECFMGWMVRKDMKNGEIFERKTVTNKVDITSDSTSMVPAFFDVEKNEFVWADMAIRKGGGYNNLASSSKSISMVVESMMNLVKPTLHDLFRLHAEARGTLVSKKEEADLIFSMHEGVTPYAFDVISSDYLVNAVPDAPVVKVAAGMKKKR
jgi:stress response protein SCP2